MVFEFSLSRRFIGEYVARFQIGQLGYQQVSESAFEAVIGAIYGWTTSTTPTFNKEKKA